MNFPLKEKRGLSPDEVQCAKNVSVVSVLAALGYQPVSKTGGELVYHSPKTDEKTPSFFVNRSRNVFNDFSGGERGDVIRLVQYLTGRTFGESVAWLLSLSPDSFSFSGSTSAVADNGPEDRGETALVVERIRRALTHPALIRYVERRAVSAAVAGRYCREINFRNTSNGGSYFAVGFANDGGGWALRNGAGFKGQIAPAGITTLAVGGATVANVFEGFFDFLSAVVLFGSPRNTTIVLNSTSNLTAALPALRNFESLNLYLDRDDSGRKAVERLQGEGFKFHDRSDLYTEWKDLNEFLIKR